MMVRYCMIGTGGRNGKREGGREGGDVPCRAGAHVIGFLALLL